jgi:hypothetical protein
MLALNNPGSVMGRHYSFAAGALRYNRVPLAMRVRASCHAPIRVSFKPLDLPATLMRKLCPMPREPAQPTLCACSLLHNDLVLCIAAPEANFPGHDAPTTFSAPAPLRAALPAYRPALPRTAQGVTVPQQHAPTASPYQLPAAAPATTVLPHPKRRRPNTPSSSSSSSSLCASTTRQPARLWRPIGSPWSGAPGSTPE